MHRTLYVLVYPSRLFAAHWSFWIPYLDADGRESDVGDRIHVTGDRLNGFQYEHLRHYNVREDERLPNSFPIGLLDPASVEKGNGHDWGISGVAEEITPVNRFDKVCREVEAPGPSLNKVATTAVPNVTAGAPKKREVRDCQWWIKQAAAHLVEAGVLLPLDKAHGGGTPADKVAALPKH
ncbi:hypothetical protein GE09DRAFT_208882 [Coniochaeta sp. 2T2.1]|nr:hypothetical protein GE09DRAFT_208882 [Coniochaeta sp. 2T2.1]